MAPASARKPRSSDRLDPFRAPFVQGPMSHFPWLRSVRIRRGIALSAVVLSIGGLVLYKSSAYASNDGLAELAAGKSSATFAGPGAHGMISMSHTYVGP